MSIQSFEAIQVVANEASRASQKKRRRHRAAQAPRNLTIFKKVEIEKFTHDEVAQKYNIDRSRVSQIVKQVRMELAHASANDPEIKDHLARQRLDQHLEKLRLEYALEAAAKAMRRDAPRLVTNRAGSRQKGDAQEGWSEVITRDTTPNVQTIKTYLRVSQDLGKLRDREAETAPPSEKPSYEELFDAIEKTLAHFFRRVQHDDDAPTGSFVSMVERFRANICLWLIRRRQGVPRADAWPDPPLPTSLPERLAALRALWRAESGYDDHYAHHAPSEINPELTTSSDADADTTSDQPNSCADPAYRAPPIVLPM